METEARKQETFGEAVRRLRELRNITQNRFGMLSGISPSNVARIERGERGVPETGTVASVADALNLTAAERIELFQAALWDRLIGELERMAAYYLVLMDTEQRNRERFLAAAQEMSDDEFQHYASVVGNLNGNDLRALAKMIAESPEDAQVRALLLRRIMNSIDINLDEHALTIGWRRPQGDERKERRLSR
jgi:transcriptional regulator with XRE-family HTH domain